MADLVLCPLLELIIDKLASPFLEKFHDLYNLRENIKKLQQSLPTAHALLEDALKRRETEKAVKDWLLKLKDIAYESEDLLDEIAVEAKLCQLRSSNRMKVPGLFWPFGPSNNLFELAENLQNKLKELDDIVKQGFILNLREMAAERPAESLSRTETGSSVLESKIYGRELDKERILKFLLPSDKGKTVKGVYVIPIVGLGGLGKTIVAQLVYNDEKVRNYFNLRIWVYVSKDFDRRKIMISIIESVNDKKCELLSIDQLESQLQASLRGMKFLLILDDVWNEDKLEWDKLDDRLQCGAEGSRVIVTTRSHGVASIVGATSMYNLEELTEEDCWVIFKQQAFSPEEEKEHPNLLAIGRKIIKKCGGVPLAANTLGILLRRKREEKDWFDVQDSELWNNEECQKSGILPALRLSYTQLPLHLQRCFAFCSLFPKDYEVKKEKLIYTWMAEGLIRPHGGRKRPEDIGDEYFSELLRFSFFQEVARCENGSILYKMNDLIHDLARSIGGNDFEILGHGMSPGNLAQVRHLTITHNFDQTFLANLFNPKRLRTFIFLCPGESCETFPSFLPSFIYLRVLDLSGCGIKRVDESISDLICLRYLDLSTTPITELPHTICNLCNLQILSLSACYNLVQLPFGMANLISMRHLNTKGCERLACMPPGIGKLVHLQTLPIYIVGKGFGESIAELSTLNLRGELTIKCLENVKDAKEAKMANLREKKHLQLLRLEWGCCNEDPTLEPEKGTVLLEEEYEAHHSLLRYFRGEDENDVEGVLQGLEPCVNLKKLHISGYPGRKFPSWDLPYLVEVVLINCWGCKKLPSFGRLPQLQCLFLQGMNAVTHIAEEFYTDVQTPFPILKELTLRDFPHLEEWSGNGRTAFPCLKKLTLDKCPNLKTAPGFPSLENLELRNCHPNIISSLENITSIKHLVIDMFPTLPHLSGQLLENNKSLVSLEIRSCHNIRLLPSGIENASTLESLIISCCEKLSYLPTGLHKLRHLDFFEITGCHRLTFLPQDGIGGSGSLKTFSVESCNSLNILNGFHHLTALEQLYIMCCPRLTSLPDSFKGFSALRSLSIISCPELVCLPMSLQYVTTLQSLVIHECPGLTDLPDWFVKFSSLRSLAISKCKFLRFLPEGMKELRTLQHLSIQDCPHLRLLSTKKGTEWQKIAHVPHKYIS